MSKMLMGQIDHARGRIKQITREKLGDGPTYPEVPTPADFTKGLKDGTIRLTNALVTNAIAAWEDQSPRLEVTASTSRWIDGNYQNVGGGKIKTLNSGDLDDYLAYMFYRNVYEAAVAKFDTDYAEFTRRKAIIEGEAVTVEDAIVLGDNAAALLALQRFAAFTL